MEFTLSPWGKPEVLEDTNTNKKEFVRRGSSYLIYKPLTVGEWRSAKSGCQVKTVTTVGVV